MNGQQRTWVHENEIRAWHDTHYAHTSPRRNARPWQHFANLQDPYNTGNFMTGWVQMIGGDEYGNLLIEEINERPAPQRITATTPKTSYPYRRDRAWLMNQSQWVRAALKYDGTNICQYSYRDADGNRFHHLQAQDETFRASPPSGSCWIAASGNTLGSPGSAWNPGKPWSMSSTADRTRCSSPTGRRSSSRPCSGETRTQGT